MDIPLDFTIAAAAVFFAVGFLCSAIAFAGMHRDEDILYPLKRWWHRHVEERWHEARERVRDWYRARDVAARLADVERSRARELTEAADVLARRLADARRT